MLSGFWLSGTPILSLRQRRGMWRHERESKTGMPHVRVWHLPDERRVMSVSFNLHQPGIAIPLIVMASDIGQHSR